MRVTVYRALPLALLLIALLGAVGCSNQPSYSDSAKLPSPPSNPGTADQLQNTMWGTPTATISFYPQGVVSFEPKQNGALRLTGSYTVDNGVVMATIMGVEPIAATWDGSKLTIQGVECTHVGAPSQPTEQQP